jgi:progesterone-induced-blocking factor 1
MMMGTEPETIYTRLRGLPDRDLPASEWLLVNVWELVYPVKKELDEKRRENMQLREEIKINNDKHHQLLN